jgi:hypothetical protein
MTDATAEFFEGLDRGGYQALLAKTRGTLAFDLLADPEPERWLVTVDGGDVAVSHATGSADCTVRAPRELFDRVVRGEVNAMAALLRDAVEVDGDPALLVRFQRLFPGPPARGGSPPVDAHLGTTP